MMATPSTRSSFASRLAEAKRLHREGNFEEARKKYEKLLRKQPVNQMVLSLLGVLHLQCQQYPEAVDCLRKACAKPYSDSDLPYNLGLAYYHLHDYEQAVKSYLKSVEMNPEHDRAYCMMSKAYLEWNKRQYRTQALTALLKDIEVTGRFDSYVMAAELLHEEGKYQDARGLAKRALEMEPTSEIGIFTLAKTIVAENYDKAYVDVRHAEPVIKAGDLILKMNPNSWRGHHVIAEALAMIGETELALQHYQKVNQIKPDFPVSRTNAGILMLRQGRLRDGWNQMSYRKAHGVKLFGIDVSAFDSCRADQWEGQIETGKKLLIACEQGIGDQFLYCQMLRDLIEAGMEIHMTCTDKILPMLERSLPQMHFYASSKPLPQEIIDGMDYKTDLMDVGKYLRDDLAKFGSPFHFLVPDSGLVASFREKYSRFDGRLKVGISWKSSSKSVGSLKSTALKQWKEILTIPGVQFINIQYGSVADEISEVNSELGIDIFVDDFDPFFDIEKALAQISVLDLVISVSNAAVHMAGQLGIPTWIILNCRPLWHWFEAGNTSLWYESVTLFRQDQLENWEPVLHRVADDLRHVLGSGESGEGENA